MPIRDNQHHKDMITEGRMPEMSQELVRGTRDLTHKFWALLHLRVGSSEFPSGLHDVAALSPDS